MKNKTQATYQKAKALIPGGTGLLTKRPEMFLPDFWPAYYKKAKGCHVWDLDDHCYIDMSYMGIGACILGYADAEVDKAVIHAIHAGSMTTLNSPEEVELAQCLCEIHKWARMVRFARTGGEAMAIAVRIARAATEKDLILFCGYHGWHDWYIAANLSKLDALDDHLLHGLKSKGVPRSLQGTVIPFSYNQADQFRELLERYSGRVAAVVMEPVRNHLPEAGFLETVRQLTRERGIVLVFDEITSGWRLVEGGAHLTFGITPDIAVFAKGMSNGYPMAAVIGIEKVLDAAQETFISSTYWTERIGPAAALATIRKMQLEGVSHHLMAVGQQVKNGWREKARKNGLDICVSGIDPLGHFSFLYNQPLLLKTLFTQCMLDKGFLATNAFYASLAHEQSHVQAYLEAVGETFQCIAGAIQEGCPKEYLRGPVCQGGFKRLT